MARGEMVRFLAEHRIEDPKELKGFARLGYHFSESESSDREYVFVKNKYKDIAF